MERVNRMTISAVMVMFIWICVARASGTHVPTDSALTQWEELPEIAQRVVGDSSLVHANITLATAFSERFMSVSHVRFRSSDELVGLMSEGETTDAKVWDSGARRHVVRDRNRLKPGTERACPFRIRGINSGGSQPLCMGDAEEYVPLNDGSVVTVPLMGAVFMPEAPHDIISPGILEKDGFCSWDGKLPDGRSVVLENHRFILMPACKPRQKTHTLASKEQSILVGEENTTNETKAWGTLLYWFSGVAIDISVMQ